VFQSISYVLQFHQATRHNNALQFSVMEITSLLIAALSHDCGHPGFNNAFLINTRHPLAIQYNDTSVLENYHCYRLFSIIFQTPSTRLTALSQQPTPAQTPRETKAVNGEINHQLQQPSDSPETADRSANILEYLDPADLKLLRQLVIDFVIGTDMTAHFQHVARVGSLADRPNTTSFSDGEKKMLLTALVHMCDISNPCKSFASCSRWATRIQEEYFHQVR
jgi:hypothetical protein